MEITSGFGDDHFEMIIVKQCIIVDVKVNI